ncbi:MAG TPA: type II secretion system protein [Pyrinomonadaceae bacterium]|nr:type II secretion system protein [Pyrinomonadaceae bacterium]
MNDLNSKDLNVKEPSRDGGLCVSTASLRQRGFSLLELMIAMFILIILISVAVPSYQRAVQNARESVLKENLWQMRRAIDQYYGDKGKPPRSLDDLVSAKYLRERPIDPMTETDDWTEITETDDFSANAEPGMTDIKSSSDGVDSEGKSYREY